MGVNTYLSITASGFSIAGYGTFDGDTRTATLTAPCDKMIRIESDGITLTSDGVMVDGHEHVGIYLCNVENITLRNLEIHGYKIGVYCQNCKHIVMEELTLCNTIYGISMEQMKDVTISNSNFCEIKQDAISVVECRQCTLTNNKIKEVLRGVVIDDSKEVLVSNTSLYEMEEAMELNNCEDAMVCKNIIFDGKDGIIVQNGTGTLHLSENYITNMGQNGIYLYKVEHFNVENNTIKKIRSIGIEITLSKKGLLYQNRIAKANVGVGFENMSSENLLRNNQIVDCKNSCIELAGTNNVVETNNILGCL